MRKVIGILSLLFFAALPLAAQTPLPIRVKCGGPAFTDSKGQLWQADFGYNGGQTSPVTGTVAGTTDPGIFQLGRWGDSTATPLTYTFPVANGAYHVNLYFVELNTPEQKTGARVFNVKMQGTAVLSKLDVFAAAGANNALIRGTDVTVSDGKLQIEFDNIVDHAKVQGIEITQTSSAPELDLSFTYPDGTPVDGTLNYTVATSLLKLGGSKPLDHGKAAAMLYGGPQILGLAGQFQLDLNLIDATGRTLWQVGMTMNPTNVNFGAVQSSALNVIVQKN